MNVLNAVFELFLNNPITTLCVAIVIFLLFPIACFVYRASRKEAAKTERISQNEYRYRLDKITSLRDNGAISEREFKRGKKLLLMIVNNNEGLRRIEVGLAQDTAITLEAKHEAKSRAKTKKATNSKSRTARKESLVQEPLSVRINRYLR